MNLIKTSFYASIATVVTFISGFIVTKFVAVKIGPSGIAYVGQFTNTVAILTMIATGAITTGVVKYLAGYQNDREKQASVIATALKIILICSFIVSLFVIIASNYLSNSAFRTREFWPVFVLYGIFLTILSLNTLFVSIFNGLKQIKKLTIINITGSLAGIIFTITFANFLGVTGVLIASNFTALIVFILNLWFLKDFKGLQWKPDFRIWDKKLVQLLFAFTLMTMTSGLLTPFTQLMIRGRIIENFSIAEAGYWQAVTRISDYYLGFITTVLSIYYLPRLSEINEKQELRKEIFKGYKLILPAVGIMAMVIWLLRSLIVHILFTPEFMPMLPLFKYQLLGDFFKIGSWLVSFIMVSKALTKVFIMSEIGFSVTQITLSYYFIGHFGIIGATYAFCINYAAYWIVMWFLMKKHFK